MKIINFIKEIRWGIAVALILLLFTFLLCLIAMSNKYDEELSDLRKDNEKQKATIESQGILLTEKEEEIERSRNGCGVYEYEQGYIIDGYYYEFKGEADIQMEE